MKGRDNKVSNWLFLVLRSASEPKFIRQSFDLRTQL